MLNGKLHISEELWDLIYPVGSTYETWDENFNPNDAFSGEWTRWYHDKDIIPVGSCCLYPDSWSSDTPCDKQLIMQAYHYQILEAAFPYGGFWNVPNGYKRFISFTCHISTRGSANGCVYINNVEIFNINTWSDRLYKMSVTTPRFDVNTFVPKRLIDFGGSYERIWSNFTICMC